LLGFAFIAIMISRYWASTTSNYEDTYSLSMMMMTSLKS